MTNDQFPMTNEIPMTKFENLEIENSLKIEN